MSEWQYQPECRCHCCTQIRSAGTLAGAAQGMNVDHDPAKSLLKPLPPNEKAELQVSLLNEIGLTLTAVAERLKPIERIDTIEGMILDLAQRLYGRLEGIETTLIKEFIDAKQSRDSDYALDDRRWEVMHDRMQAIESQLTAMAKEQVAHREVFKCLSLQLQAIDNDLAAKWATCLAQIEERLERNSHGQQQAFALTCKIQESLEDVNGAEFTQLKCLLDLTNKRLKALELGEPRKAGKRKRVKR